MPTIRTDRLILRAPEVQDLAPYTAYRMSERVALASGTMTEFEANRSFMELVGHWTARGFGRWVIALDDASAGIGHTGFLQMTPDTVPEHTWTLWSAEYEGQGYATEAARAALDYARAHLGLSQVQANVYPANTASLRVAERLGARLRPDLEAPDYMPGALTYDFQVAA
ncbi:MAG: GNAT family protein [Pseudomonadota bacterium]